MPVQGVHQIWGTLGERSAGEEDPIEDNFSVHCRIRKGLPRQEVHLPSHGVHSRQGDVWRNPRSQDHEQRYGPLLFRLSYALNLVPALQQHRLPRPQTLELSGWLARKGLLDRYGDSQRTQLWKLLQNVYDHWDTALHGSLSVRRQWLLLLSWYLVPRLHTLWVSVLPPAFWRQCRKRSLRCLHCHQEVYSLLSQILQRRKGQETHYSASEQGTQKARRVHLWQDQKKWLLQRFQLEQPLWGGNERPLHP